jgi:hypothetical protein
VLVPIFYVRTSMKLDAGRRQPNTPSNLIKRRIKRDAFAVQPVCITLNIPTPLHYRLFDSQINIKDL